MFIAISSNIVKEKRGRLHPEYIKRQRKSFTMHLFQQTWLQSVENNTRQQLIPEIWKYGEIAKNKSDKARNTISQTFTGFK